MAVTLPAAAFAPVSWFSLYDSPYPSHARGCAIDLYPADTRTPPPGTAPATGDGPLSAPAPVAGEVLETRAVDAPTRPYAGARDHLLLVDVGPHVARILHVEPTVAAGDRVTVGDPLGRLVRSGYFAPWVGHHLHLEFRPHGADPYRASGSLPIDPGVAVEPVDWDGTGTVVETGPTYAVLDAPVHPSPGERFAALASDTGRPLDGGLVHYAGGGRLGGGAGADRGASVDPPASDAAEAPVSLLGTRIGTAAGRDVTWADVAIRADGARLTGLSLSVGRDALGTKLVAPDHDLSVGDRVAVTLAPGEPVRLG